jgi:hypothetical protein
MMQKCCGCLTTEFYAQYFDVDDEEVKKRLMLALWPFGSKFAD